MLCAAVSNILADAASFDDLLNSLDACDQYVEGHILLFFDTVDGEHHDEASPAVLTIMVSSAVDRAQSLYSISVARDDDGMQPGEVVEIVDTEESVAIFRQAVASVTRRSFAGVHVVQSFVGARREQMLNGPGESPVLWSVF